MQTYPECAATPDEAGANFTPFVIGDDIRRLREAKGNPFSRVLGEASKFHQRMAKKHGVETPRGMAHYRLAEAFGRPTSKLQEYISTHGEFGNLGPKVVQKAHKDSIEYHKKQAEKHGLGTPMGRAHISAMSHHVSEYNQSKKESQFGHSGRENPIGGVPKKSEQPSEDIRQKKPLMKLQSKTQAARAFGRQAFGPEREGGPGSGPRKGGRVEIIAGPHTGKTGTITGKFWSKGEGRIPGHNYHLVKIDGVKGKPQTFAPYNVKSYSGSRKPFGGPKERDPISHRVPGQKESNNFSNMVSKE
jgi:hypothetical protein